MSRKKNTNWSRIVKKQAEREEMHAENRRGLLRELSPEAPPAPPSAPAIAAELPGVGTGTSFPTRPAHAPTCICAKCHLKRTS
jgi:hypothetical protein